MSAAKARVVEIDRPATAEQIAQEVIVAGGWDTTEDLVGLLYAALNKTSATRDAAVSFAARKLARPGGELPRGAKSKRSESLTRLADRCDREEGGDDTSGLVALAETNLANIFETRLGYAGGKRLGEASRDDVERERDGYMALQAGVAKKVRWYKFIAEKMPIGKSVIECLTQKQLIEMWRKASLDV